MSRGVIRLYTPPKPTRQDPYAQLEWVFFQVEAEFEEPSAARFRYAKNKYFDFVTETNSYYPELEQNRCFYLEKYWEADALIRFSKWLVAQGLTSKTRYSVYKSVRQVMDVAYALRIVDTIVYHAPMFKGVSETKERSAYTKQEQDIINTAVAKWIGLVNSVLSGYTPTGKGIPYRCKNNLPPINIDDRVYKTGEAAGIFWSKHELIIKRLKQHWTPRQVLGLEERKPFGTKITVEGFEYNSISGVALAYGMDHGVIRVRLSKGYSPEQAVGVEPILVPPDDDRALLWMFENTYCCDAYAMREDFHFRRNLLTRTCTEKRLLKLFARWGVWPHIDDRLVLPLVVEMAMLTALNVESLKMLEVDSFQLKHRLSQPQWMIYWWTSWSIRGFDGGIADFTSFHR